MKIKQETLEEVAEKYSRKMWGVYFDDKHPDSAINETQGEISVKDFINGYRLAQETLYSEEDVLDILFCMVVDNPKNITDWFEQFKK